MDIYLPDLKYLSAELSAAYSHAPDYFEIACAAIAEMYRQAGDPVIDPGYRSDAAGYDCASSPSSGTDEGF